MRPRALLKSGVIFIAMAAGLTVAIYYFAAPVLDLLLPLYRVELQGLMPDFHIDSLAWRFDRGETVVALSATLANLKVVLDRVIPAGVSINASTLAAHVWVYPVLILSLVASWPGVDLRHRPGAIVLSLPFALLGMVLDIPLMLWGAVEDYLYWQVDPARVSESLGSRVQHFLDGGGRYAMAIGLALLTIVLFRTIVPGPTACAEPESGSDSKKRPRRLLNEPNT